jgi:hypothetical protein
LSALGGVNAKQRQLIQYLRTGSWVSMSKLPIPVSPALIERITQYGWIETRGEGQAFEIKLTPEGLAALQTPV